MVTCFESAPNCKSPLKKKIAKQDHTPDMTPYHSLVAPPKALILKVNSGNDYFYFERLDPESAPTC